MEKQWKGCAVAYVCHKPGANTIFNMASPTFKLRFMYMAGYEDEEQFDAFAQALTLRGVGERMSCPYLVVAGEDDDLSPLEYTYELLDEVKAPKELLLYQGERHGLNTTTASALGPRLRDPHGTGQSLWHLDGSPHFPIFFGLSLNRFNRADVLI